MYDLKRTYGDDSKERSVAAGEEIGEEGMLLRGILESGVEVASKTLGSSSDDANIIGWSVNTGLISDQDVVIEDVEMDSVPSPVTLSNSNIVADSERVYNVTDGVLYTKAAGAPGATEYTINEVNGLLTVGANGADDTFRVTYRYTMTALQKSIIRHQRPVNQGATTLFGLVAVLRGSGEIFTDQYDTQQAYSDTGVAAESVYTDPNNPGFVTSAAGGLLIANAKIIKVPTPDDPFLGIRFNFA